MSKHRHSYLQNIHSLLSGITKLFLLLVVWYEEVTKNNCDLIISFFNTSSSAKSKCYRANDSKEIFKPFENVENQFWKITFKIFGSFCIYSL